MRKLSQQFAAVGFAFLLVASGLAGVAQIGAVGDRVDQERSDVAQLGERVSPVQEVEAIAPIAIGIGAIAAYEVGTYFLTGDGDKVDAADAEQAMIDIYSSAAGVHDSDETYLTTLQNYLQDTEEVALMEGKNAAIKAYMNDSTEIQSEQAARDAIEDYYSAKQVVMVKNWNNSIVHYDYLENVSESETGVSSNYVDLTPTQTQMAGGGADMDIRYDALGESSVTLANGTAIPVKTLEVTAMRGTETRDSASLKLSDATKQIYYEDYNGDNYWRLDSAMVRASTISGGDYDDLQYIDASEYPARWSEIETQASQTGSEVVTFVNATYDQWGDQINESDLIDPYLGSRDYSPEGDYRAWALRSYTSLGLDSPANLSTFGTMTIVEDSTQVEGILMSGGLPANDTFKVDTTYNASQIAGYQFVIGETQTWELEGEFSIVNMTNAEGDSMNKTVYRNITYETANLSEYQAVADELAELRGELEAMKQNAGGGGWTLPSFGFGGLVPGLGVIGLIFVGLAALVILKE